MRDSGNKRHEFGKLSPAEITTRVMHFLRRLYPSRTACEVAADTGLPEKTIRKWLDLENAPSGAAFCTLTLVYGPDFLEAVLPNSPDWVSSAARAGLRARIEAKQINLAARLQQLGAARG